MSKTPIEWTERTWNPVRGCSPVSPGCAHCYAEQQGGRFCGPGRPFDGFIQIGKNGRPGKHWTGKVELIEHMLDVPLRTRKPTTWFVNSMSDLFHENLADDVIDRVFAVMALCAPVGCSRRFNKEPHPEHTFQALTKRSWRMGEYFAALEKNRRGPMMPDRIVEACHELLRDRPKDSRNLSWDLPAWPLPNVWLGVSVEDQQRADERIPDLLQTPAAVRFISAEPLLGTVDLRQYLVAGPVRNGRGGYSGREAATEPIDWVIVGGESGPGARPFDIRWARSIVQQCQDAGVPCFVKQLGSHAVQASENGLTFRFTGAGKRWGKGGDMAEWPGDLRVRQMPEVVERPRFVR